MNHDRLRQRRYPQQTSSAVTRTLQISGTLPLLHPNPHPAANPIRDIRLVGSARKRDVAPILELLHAPIGVDLNARPRIAKSSKCLKRPVAPIVRFFRRLPPGYTALFNLELAHSRTPSHRFPLLGAAGITGVRRSPDC
jgi:hypothetical protein